MKNGFFAGDNCNYHTETQAITNTVKILFLLNSILMEMSGFWNKSDW